MKASALVVAAISAAAAVPTSAVEKRELGGVLICTGANATGQCSYRVYEMDKCQQLAAPFHRNAATFAPDGDAFACYPRVTNCGDVCMSPTGCTFGAVNFSYPHKYDLRAIRWDKLLSSFSCFATKPS